MLREGETVEINKRFEFLTKISTDSTFFLKNNLVNSLLVLQAPTWWKHHGEAEVALGVFACSGCADAPCCTLHPVTGKGILEQQHKLHANVGNLLPQDPTVKKLHWLYCTSSLFMASLFWKSVPINYTHSNLPIPVHSRVQVERKKTIRSIYIKQSSICLHVSFYHVHFFPS